MEKYTDLKNNTYKVIQRVVEHDEPKEVVEEAVVEELVAIFFRDKK